MSTRLGYPDRRHTHNCWREFARAGSDLQAFCERKRNGAVHGSIAEGWRRAPLLPTTVVCQRVKERFGLSHLSAAAVRQAGTQLDDHPMRRALHQQLEQGDVHSREGWL